MFKTDKDQMAWMMFCTGAAVMGTILALTMGERMPQYLRLESVLIPIALLLVMATQPSAEQKSSSAASDRR